jgi:hypothetical protein
VPKRQLLPLLLLLLWLLLSMLLPCALYQLVLLLRLFCHAAADVELIWIRAVPAVAMPIEQYTLLIDDAM